jgi:shikimate kinase
MLRNPRVYIIGFMGSGKTTAGRKLAVSLDWSFIDLDKQIEDQTGKRIAEIFQQDGEDYFRIVESEVLKSLQLNKNTIVSTGGGTPCYSDNMEYMLSSGITLYLKMTPAQLCSRLADSSFERPLIKGLNQGELLSFIEEKLIFREKWYNRSELIVDGFNLDINSLKSIVTGTLKS